MVRAFACALSFLTRIPLPQLTLDVLNHATQAWIEMEYNRARHSEIGEPPAERFLRGPDVGRPSPSAEELRLAFRVEETRVQRRSDGTVTIAGVSFAPGKHVWADADGVLVER